MFGEPGAEAAHDVDAGRFLASDMILARFEQPGQRAKVTLHVVDHVRLLGIGKIMTDEFGPLGRSFAGKGGEFSSLGFQQAAAAVGAAKFAGGIELVDRIFAEETAKVAGGAEARDDWRTWNKRRKRLGGGSARQQFDAFDKSRGFTEEVFAGGFFACHARMITRSGEGVLSAGWVAKRPVVGMDGFW